MKKIMVCCLLLFSFVNKLKAEEEGLKTINFYDEYGNLIVSYELNVGEMFQVPTIKKEGYNFIGFNTRSDRSGEYLYTYKVSESKNYYAIYEIIYFNVDYYVLGQLFYQTKVAYNDNAPNIEVRVAGKEFIGWTGLNQIKQDMKVDAQFNNIIIEKPEIELVNQYEESDDIEEVRLDETIKKKEEITIKEIREKDNPYYLFNIFIGIITSVVLYVVIRKIKRVFSN